MNWIPYAFFGFFGLIACIVLVVLVVAIKRGAPATEEGAAPRMSSHASDNIGSMSHHDRFN